MTCHHCGQVFHPERWVFGRDAALQRDAHVIVCEHNPRNKCFCGEVFPNPTARDTHAATCSANPANQFKCSYCSREFVSSFLMGFKTSDGRAQRDVHAACCPDNPANTCFCGQLFFNREARNAHAERCELNPVNRFKCQFCDACFVTTFNVFGFCSADGRALRDAHQTGCSRNPRNTCFCGRMFSTCDARDRHAHVCEANPANRFHCVHCQELFVTRYGMMRRVASDGKVLRDTHEQGCAMNPANKCFCGKLFRNPDARDAHAMRCGMNPANRFTCQHCQKTFLTTFGVFTSCGSVALQEHMLTCQKNPANATCEHCGRTFGDAFGVLRWMQGDAQKRCQTHREVCKLNPQNRFECDLCSRAFVSHCGWFRRVHGKHLRDAHQANCDVIPCAYQLVDADIASWSLLASSEKLCLPLLADDAEAEVFEDCTLSEDFVSSTTDVESASDSMDASSAEDGSWNTIENEFGPTANPVEAWANQNEDCFWSCHDKACWSCTWLTISQVSSDQLLEGPACRYNGFNDVDFPGECEVLCFD